MAKQKIRIRLKAYEHGVLDQSAQKIVDTAERTGAAEDPVRVRTGSGAEEEAEAVSGIAGQTESAAGADHRITAEISGRTGKRAGAQTSCR